jgi:hypothetical protein
MTTISEHQQGTRNSRVYKTDYGYGVIVFDAETDYNGFEAFADINSAEDFAEDWVMRVSNHDTI